MATADFYVSKTDGMEWLGSLSVDGSPAEMDDEDLFGPVDPPEEYTEDTYRALVRKILNRAVADDFGYSAEQGDTWPWPHAPMTETDFVYIFSRDEEDDGEQTVWVGRRAERDGEIKTLGAALHYPNGYNPHLEDLEL